MTLISMGVLLNISRYQR
ncbi:MAG: hypothetical protein V8Q71_02220 [Bacilli bacterium]